MAAVTAATSCAALGVELAMVRPGEPLGFDSEESNTPCCGDCCCICLELALCWCWKF